MDWSSLRETVSNLTLYDVKAGVRKVQNAVMNYTEIEAKVREATNNEPWGASSSLMQEIANATFTYQGLNEVMPMIYKRFTEKTAEEWRQIYKALQLLEFLIKNGSERVIDDARSHLSLLKMLRQFHYIDMNGKDQGINVRNRSKELTELLSDVDKIRAERKKARANRNKYSGYEGGGGFGLGGSSGPRMGGFGNNSGGSANFGGFSGGVYGDGGGFGGQSDMEYQEPTARREKFEEYDEYDEGAVAAPGKRQQDGSSSPARAKRETNKPATKLKEPEEDLFDFGNEPSTSTKTSKAPASSTLGEFGATDDDEFDDFQSAAPASTTVQAGPGSSIAIAPPASNSASATVTPLAQPKPVSGLQSQSISGLFASVSPQPTSTSSSTLAPLSSSSAAPSTAFSAAQKRPSQPAGYQATGPNYFTSVPVAAQQQSSSGTSTPLSMANLGKPAAPTSAKSTGGDAFANLLGGATSRKSTPAKGTTMADMARQKASAGIWGAGATGTSAQSSGSSAQQQKLGGGLEDLLG
ncbi:uncharacterized protein PV09_07789 [Verruconis gallopava]|uniref:ENTH domain-containing protein n=1 Tax=Verruconis gallopava TaxID=253628 RepID=A0A0D2A344_9PEZI|nr:uncharacterized protein PV09_07789 [Verruconis gallopava]KIW00810.1 hypothetical protein PV09_07789 [Verruconis gallopava]